MGFDVQAYLQSLSRFGIKPGLERIRALLAHLGNPQQAFRSLHIAGTNGKGSISAFTASILKAGGYRTGLYTSPHLVRYNERIQVSGTPIGDDVLAMTMQEVARAAEAVKAELGTDPTEFEVGTAAAFLHFAREGVDFAVVEVGLGGRLDSTNVIDAQVCAVGPISKDHTSVLGESLADIAREKAGIFRAGKPVVCSPQISEVDALLRQIARGTGSPMIRVIESEGADGLVGRDTHSDRVVDSWEQSISTFYVREWNAGGGRVDVQTPWRSYKNLEVPLLGRHQLQNAATAVTLVDAFIHTPAGVPQHEDAVQGEGVGVGGELEKRLSPDAVMQGVASTRWPGRLELIPGEPSILFDGVHNPGGAQVLAQALKRLFPGRRLVFVIALLGEKDDRATLAPLLPLASQFFVTRPASARMEPASLQRLMEIAREYGVQAQPFDRAADALVAACDAAGPDGLVCVCGSLYLVGEVKAHLEVVGHGEKEC